MEFDLFFALGYTRLMRIKSIVLQNFRSHENLSLDFLPGINFLCGANAKGKTNVVEAIYYFATTKSFRTSKDNLAVTDGKQQATATMQVERNFGNLTLQMQIDKVQKKVFYKNGEKMTSPSKILGNFCAVLFSPDEMKIAKGSPEDRRNFIDTAISKLSGSYFDLLAKFDKILFSRNLLLKRGASDAEIDVYDEQFAIIASKILKQRQTFVKKLADFAKENTRFLSSGCDELKIKYDCPFTSDNLKDEILSALGANRLRDREVGYTTLGPHRDDLMLMISGKDIRQYGSQGQQRTAVLALKLAEYDVLKDTIGESPVLLLDDVFSELDASRAKLLFERVRTEQTIITGTRARTANFNYSKIKI